MSISTVYDANDALGLARLVRDREVSPRELLDEAIARVLRHNPALNAVVIPMYEEARRLVDAGLPDGPLRGVPFLLKDLSAPYAGVPLRSASWAYDGFVPKEHGELVKRYLAAGVAIFGKTSSSEFGILPTTESRRYGPCHNPWKLGTTTGGSSGGAAAAVAARLVPAAHGGDAGGSIRIPASCCGVFGLKPTRGRNPCGPEQSERAHGLAAEHVLSVSVRDSAAFLDATAGPEIGAPYWAPPKAGPYLDETTREPGKLRVAYTSKPLLPGEPHPDCTRAVEDAAALLASLGHEVEEARPPVDAHHVARCFFILYCAGVAAELETAGRFLGRPARPSDVEPTTWIMGMIARGTLSAGDASLAIRDMQATARGVLRFHETYEVLLTPTLGKPPVAHGALGPQGFEKRAHELVARYDLGLALRAPGMLDKAVARAYAFTPFTMLANITGQPSMSVPLWWNAEGMPIGVCFTGRFGGEATLFRLAAQLEKARPWAGKKPPVHA
jgi:amidase